MDDERWYSLLDDLEEKIGFEDRGEEPGPGHTTVEWVTFQGPKGFMKLERISRPVVVDRKMHYSKRARGEVEEELIYSDSEKSYHVALYVRSPGGQWNEIDFRALTG